MAARTGGPPGGNRLRGRARAPGLLRWRGEPPPGCTGPEASRARVRRGGRRRGGGPVDRRGGAPVPRLLGDGGAAHPGSSPRDGPRARPSVSILVRGGDPGHDPARGRPCAVPHRTDSCRIRWTTDSAQVGGCPVGGQIRVSPPCGWEHEPPSTPRRCCPGFGPACGVRRGAASAARERFGGWSCASGPLSDETATRGAASSSVTASRDVRRSRFLPLMTPRLLTINRALTNRDGCRRRNARLIRRGERAADSG